MNPSSLVTIASSRKLQHWRCLPFMFRWNLYFLWPNLETHPSDVTKSPIQKCSKTLIGNFCLHGKKVNMLLAVFLFALQRGISAENLIYINSWKPLRYTVAMITKHSNESARHYYFHGDVKVKACGEVMDREWPWWSRGCRKILQI